MAYTAPIDWHDNDDTTPANATNVKAMEAALAANAEPAFSTYKHLREAAAILANPSVAGTYVLDPSAAAAVSGAAAGRAVFYFDPANFTASTRTTKLRIDASVIVNATAPAGNFTFGLYPVSASAGGAATVSITLGTVVAGSTVLFTAPALSTRNQANSGDFTAPAAGFYALGVVTSATIAASSAVALKTRLVLRQV